VELFPVFAVGGNLACKPPSLSNVHSAGNSVLTIVNPQERFWRDRIMQET